MYISNADTCADRCSFKHAYFGSAIVHKPAQWISQESLMYPYLKSRWMSMYQCCGQGALEKHDMQTQALPTLRKCYGCCVWGVVWPYTPMLQINGPNERALVSRLHIQGYPSIYLFKDGKAWEYTGPRGMQVRRMSLSIFLLQEQD